MSIRNPQDAATLALFVESATDRALFLLTRMAGSRLEIAAPRY